MRRLKSPFRRTSTPAPSSPAPAHQKLASEHTLLSGLSACLLGLLLLESAARVAWTVRTDLDVDADRSERARSIAYSADLGWRRRPGYAGIFDGGLRQFDGAGYLSSDASKIANTSKKKLVFIGDSNTFGFGVGTEESFVRVVERLVPNICTINLGVIGYSSYQGRLLFEREVPLLSPDVVVIAFNFNDRRAQLNERGPDGPESFARAYWTSQRSLLALAMYVERSYLYRGMRFAMGASGLIKTAGADAGGQVRLDMLQPRVGERAYRQNLNWMALEAHRRAIPVLFIAMKDNPFQTQQLRTGLERLSTSDYDAGIGYLTRAVEARNIFSDLARIRLADTYRSKGHHSKAVDVVTTSETWNDFAGGPPIRLDSVYNQIMKEVAEASLQEFVDAGAILDRHPYDYIDAVHFNADGHQLVAAAVADRLTKMLASTHLETRRSGRTTAGPLR